MKIKKLDIKDGKAKMPVLYRALEIERAAENETRTLSLSFSSEDPYRRWFGDEILGHDAKEIKLDWFKSGNAPLLMGHDSSQQIGIIEKATVKEGRGFATVRFSKRAEADAVLEDIKDGIIKNVSVGYRVNKMTLIEESEDGPDVYRVTDWEPLEASIVSVPADQSVGVMRQSDETREFDAEITKGTQTKFEFKADAIDMESLALALKKNKPEVLKMADDKVVEKEVKVMDEEGNKAAIEQGITDNQKKVSEIIALGQMHKMGDQAVEAIKSGMSVEDFKDSILAAQAKKSADQKADINHHDPLGLNEKEQNQYSLFRAIGAAASGNWAKAGFELECSRAVADRNGKDPVGFYMPLEIGGFGKRDLTVGTTTAGGFLKGTDHRSDLFVTALYNKLVLTGLGARTMTGLVGDVAIPAMNASTSFYWVAESGAPTEGAPTVRQISMAPKTVAAYVDISRKLQKQSSPDAEMIFRDDMLSGAAVAIDAVGINGGGTNEPTGIIQTNGIGSVAIGTNGGAPTWASIVNLEREVAVDNAADGSLAYLTNHKMKSKMAQVVRVASTDSQMLLDDPWTSLYGHKAEFTNNVPSNLTKGTSSEVCSAMIFGNFNDVILGQWGSGVDILVDPYTGSTTSTLRITVFLDVDVAVRRAQSFAACLDYTTT